MRDGGLHRASSRQITAIDAKTVEFQLCAPDVGVPVRRSRSRRSASRTPTTWPRTRPTSRTSTQPNGTGPYSSASGPPGEQLVYDGQPELLGQQAPRRRPASSSAGAPRPRPAAASSCSRARSTASTTPATTTSPTIQGDSDAAVQRPRAAQHVLTSGMNNTIKPVEQREDPPGDRAWASTGSGSSTTSTRQAPRSRTHFTPVRDRRSAARAIRLGRSISTPPRRCSPRLAEEGIDCDLRPRSSSATPVRGYVPDPPRDRDRRSQPSSRRTWASTSSSTLQESGTFLDDFNARQRSTACSCSAGAPTIRIRPTSSTTTSARRSGAKFGSRSTTSQRPLQTRRARRSTMPPAQAAYAEANNLDQAARAGGLDAPRRLGHRVQGRRRGRAFVSARATRSSRS